MISKAPYNKKSFINDLIFMDSARSGWELALNSIKSKYGYTKILLPSYIGFTEREGSGIFDPVQNTESEFTFYPINEDLSINYDSVESLIQSGKFNVLLVVHYFGFCRNDLSKIRVLCDENDVIMVEDCAHAFHLWSEREGLGVTGDISFYSVHKYLPVSDGGILKNISNKVKVQDPSDNTEISLASAVQLLKSDYESIAKIRRSNFNLYAKELKDINGLEIMYSNLQENEIPQTFPIRIKNGLREKLYFYLMEKEMPTIALYYRLIDELEKDTYELSHQISNEILNLPLHQDIDDSDIEQLTGEIKKFLAEIK